MWTSSHKLTLSTYTKVNSHFHFLRSSSFKSPADKLLFKLLHPYLWSLCRAEHELALPCVHFAQSQAAGFSVLLQLLLLPLLQIPVRGWVMICTRVVAVAVALRDRRGKISAHSDYCEQHLPDRWNNLNIWLRGGADKRSDLKVEDVPFCFCRICWDWTAEKADHVILTIFSFSDSVRSSSVNCLQSQRGMKSAQKRATKSRVNHSTKSLFHSRTRHQIRSSFSS